MFDPYHKWLGIPPGQRPPTHYQLLGIAPEEQDREVIEEAAIRQTAHLRTYQAGPHAQVCTRLLNEVAQARATLLEPAKREQYDARLGSSPVKEPSPPPEPNEWPLPLLVTSSYAAARKRPWQLPLAIGTTLLLVGGIAVAVWLMNAPSGDLPHPTNASDSGTALTQAPKTKLEDPATTGELKIKRPGTDIAEPPPITDKPADPPPSKPAEKKTQLVGGDTGGPFEDSAEEHDFLVGLTVTTTSYAGHMVIKSVQPIYRTSTGKKVSKRYGQPGGQGSHVEAKDGYAVGALIAKGGHRLDGFKVVFMRIAGEMLNSRDSYESAWLGGRGGGAETLLGGDGKPVIGIYGKCGADVDALGLIQLDTGAPGDTPVTTEVKPEPKLPPLSAVLSGLQPGGFSGRGGAARAELLREGGGNEQSEAAVALGLSWLAKSQLKDGRWILQGYDPGFGQPDNPVAATALALLPFLGTGETHKQGRYQDKVFHGLDYLCKRQNRLGQFSDTMYAQALATLAVCEAYGLTKDPRLQEPARRGISFIVTAQHKDGGWRYQPNQQGDTSVTGWQVQALKTSEYAGLSVPKETWQAVADYLDSVARLDGGYGYLSKSDGGSATSAIGLLYRQYPGLVAEQPDLRKGMELLKTTPPNRSLNNIYFYYYATQVLRHKGGEDWEFWNAKIRDLLIEKQDRDRNPKNRHLGSWSPVRDEWGKQGGRLMVTSLSLLTLEVYYRHLPLHFRGRGTGMKERGDRNQ